MSENPGNIILQAEGVLWARKNCVAFESKTKSTHKLKQIAMRCVLKHKGLFCMLAELQPGTNPLCKLPALLMTQLLELECNNQAELIKQEARDSDVVQQCQVLQLLLNPEISSFRFPPRLHSDHQDEATQLWRTLLAEQRPKLSSIEYSGDWEEGDPDCWDTEAFFKKMLPVLPNLVELRFDCFVCDDAILSSIADHLPHLRVLTVELSEDVSRVGFEALSNLKQLREFIFSDNIDLDDEDIVQEVLMSTCFELLPQLHVACHKPVKLGEFHPYGLAIRTSRALRNIASPCTLQLHYLVLAHLDAFIPDHVSVSEVRALFVDDHSYNEYEELLLQPMEASRFPNVTQLILHGTEADDLIRGVEILGRQLQTLRFGISYKVVPLDRVLDACPTLSELSVLVTGLQSVRQLRRDTLKSLQVLRIQCYRALNVQPSLVLQMLLLAPNLVNVEVCSPLLSNEDLKMLTEKVEQRQCLQMLERLMVYPVARNVNYTEQWKQLLALAFASCSIHCEKLLEVISDRQILMWRLP